MSAIAASFIPDSPSMPLSGKKRTQVLIIADNPTAARDVAISLRQLGLDVLLCLFDGNKLTGMPVKAPDAVLCYLTDYIEKGESIARAARSHFAPRIIPIIGALNRPLRDKPKSFDSLLFAPMHPSQIANRVSSMIRLGVMEAEILRRTATLREDFQTEVELGDMSPHRRFRILFIGKASPSFMVIINALQDNGVDVVAAFTSFSAFEYLHGDPFDAVVMNAIEQSEPALTISSTMRRNTKLYHVPTLFLVNESAFKEKDAAFKSGACDIIPMTAEPEEIRGRILELANYHRIHEQLKNEMFEIVRDSARDETGTVFSRHFFEAHLPRILHDAEIAQKTVTLLSLKLYPHAVEDIDNSLLDLALTQSGSMIQDLVRMQDVVCRYDADRFLIACFNTTRLEAEGILARLQSLIESSAYDVGYGQDAAFTLTLESHIVESHQGVSALDLIGSAIQPLH